MPVHSVVAIAELGRHPTEEIVAPLEADAILRIRIKRVFLRHPCACSGIENDIPLRQIDLAAVVAQAIVAIKGLKGNAFEEVVHQGGIDHERAKVAREAVSGNRRQGRQSGVRTGRWFRSRPVTAVNGKRQERSILESKAVGYRPHKVGLKGSAAAPDSVTVWA